VNDASNSSPTAVIAAEAATGMLGALAASSTRSVLESSTPVSM